MYKTIRPMEILKRKLFSSIIEQLNDKEFAIVTGARQTGKTTLLNQIYSHLKEKNESVYQLTLEDNSILNRLNKHPENLFEYIIRVPNKKVFVLIDEIQYLDNPSNFLKLLFDKYYSEVKLIVTGSSAFYIDRKFKDSLAGRKRLFELFTLDLDEFLYFRTGASELTIELERIRTNATYISSRRNELNTYFNEYLTYGGYPAVVLAADHNKKTDALKELSGSFLKRDIFESNIQDQNKFYQLLVILAQQTGSLVNVNELSRLLSLSVTAIDNYLYVLRKCFHISLVRPFYKNIRKELTKMPKVYFHDLGFRNILINQFLSLEQRLDKGMLIENYAYTRLRDLYGADQLRFWRTTDGHEVDFIHILDANTNKAIEIKFNEKGFKLSKYRKFLEAYPDCDLNLRAFLAEKNKQSLLAL